MPCTANRWNGSHNTRPIPKCCAGAKAADLPVQQPVKFDLVINLQMAKQLGITIPSIVIYQADKVIQ